MNADLLQILRNHLDETLYVYGKDLDAFSPENLTKSPAPGARCAADIAYEVILNNHRGARRLRGEDPGPTVGFPACPPELANAEALKASLSASAEDIFTSVGDDPMRAIVYPGGQEPALSYGEFMVLHMQYHLGQLNYIQVLFGDSKIHWE